LLEFDINSQSVKSADKLLVIAKVALGDIRMILQKELQKA
jgi:hypothetical protein